MIQTLTLTKILKLPSQTCEGWIVLLPELENGLLELLLRAPWEGASSGDRGSLLWLEHQLKGTACQGARREVGGGLGFHPYSAGLSGGGWGRWQSRPSIGSEPHP